MNRCTCLWSKSLIVTVLTLSACSLTDKADWVLRGGNSADLTLFDRDILTIEPMEILETQVAYTIVDGNVVFEG